MSQANKAKRIQLRPGLFLTSRGPRLTRTQFNMVKRNLFDPGIVDTAYAEFLRVHNGGRPQPAYFQYCVEGQALLNSVLSFLSFNPDPFVGPTDYHLLLANMESRFQLPRYALMIGQLEDDGLLILYLYGERTGQVWVVRYPEGIEKEKDIERSLVFVAPSFQAFLELLHQPAASTCSFVFSLETDQVREGSLKQILQSLGCVQKNYGSKKDKWYTWIWPKFQQSNKEDLPAFIDIGLNGKPGFAHVNGKRPLGYPLLRIVVAIAQSDDCYHTFIDAVGKKNVKLLAKSEE